MITSPVDIDFTRLSNLLKKFIRDKAKFSKGTIVYKEGNKLIEENPVTSEKKILKQYPR